MLLCTIVMNGQKRNASKLGSVGTMLLVLSILNAFTLDEFDDRSLIIVELQIKQSMIWLTTLI